MLLFLLTTNDIKPVIALVAEVTFNRQPKKCRLNKSRSFNSLGVYRFASLAEHFEFGNLII
jgi:hypothetical protein